MNWAYELDIVTVKTSFIQGKTFIELLNHNIQKTKYTIIKKLLENISEKRKSNDDQQKDNCALTGESPVGRKEHREYI